MSTPVEAPAVPHVNEVVLVGRVSATPETKILPSGDEIAQFRLVVDRPAGRRTDELLSRHTVDTFDICCWTARNRRRAQVLHPGDVVRVEGRLQRRFFRSPAGVASRYQVDAETIRREHRHRT